MSPSRRHVIALVAALVACACVLPAASSADGVAPTITSFTPTGGNTGNTVTLTGSGFTSATSVAFNGTAASFTVVSDTTITTSVPAHAAGGPISVTGLGGTADSTESFRCYDHMPILQSFTPTKGPVGTKVVLTGLRLGGAYNIAVGHDRVTDFTVDSDTQVTITVPEGLGGSIALVTPDGATTAPGDFDVVPLPVIDGFTPAEAGPGARVTISGHNFVPASAVTFNGTPAASFTYGPTSAGVQSLYAVVPSGATSGPIAITNDGGTTSSADDFVALAAPAPHVSSFAPGVGDVGTTVTIKGANFTGISAVTIGGAAATLLKATGASVVAKVGAGAVSGDVVVTTTDGGSGTAVKKFWMKPHVLSFNPPGATDDQTVDVTGSGFSGATQVYFNGKSSAAFTVTSDDHLEARPRPGTTAGPITVTTPGGSAKSSAKYAVIAVTGLSPSHGLPGTRVTITGTDLRNANSVEFGDGAHLGSVTHISRTKIATIVPAGTITGPVIVEIDGSGGATSPMPFGIAPKITSTSLQPTPIGGTLAVDGSGFVGTTRVTINGVAAPSSVVSDSEIDVTVPAKATSGYVAVTSPGGTAKSPQKLTVVRIGSMTPLKAKWGTTVTLTGSGFTGSYQVLINGVSQPMKVVSDTKVTFKVAEGAASGYVVLETNWADITSPKQLTVG